MRCDRVFSNSRKIFWRTWFPGDKTLFYGSCFYLDVRGPPKPCFLCADEQSCHAVGSIWQRLHDQNSEMFRLSIFAKPPREVFRVNCIKTPHTFDFTSTRVCKDCLTLVTSVFAGIVAWRPIHTLEFDRGAFSCGRWPQYVAGNVYAKLVHTAALKRSRPQSRQKTNALSSLAVHQ